MLSVPFAATPEIVTSPEPVDETFDELKTKTPTEPDRVPHEVPLIVRLPKLAVIDAL